MGMVLRDWAPQLKILGHPSTEGITMGVPIAAWPMHSDQPRNAALLTQVLGMAIYVRKWECRNEKVGASMIGEAVRRLVAPEEGCLVRKKAVKLGVEVRRSVEEGGLMHKELDAFVAQITRS